MVPGNAPAVLFPVFLTDFRKTVETGMDPSLSMVLNLIFEKLMSSKSSGFFVSFLATKCH